MKEEMFITIKHNGTQFTIVLKSSENAKEFFETIIRREIEKEAMMLKEKSA